MNWIIVILCLGILIIMHEFGHYWLARILGMKVIKYSIGFFYPVFHWTSKKTDITYQVGAVPLGGFVQVKGMNPFEDGAYEDEDSYQMKAPWKRGLVILAGPVANLIIAWLILFLILTISGLPEQLNESTIGGLAPNAPAQAAGLKAGDVVLSANGKKLSTWDELAEFMHGHPEKDVVLLVQRDGRRFPVMVVPENVEGIGLIGIYPPTENVSLGAGKAAKFAVVKCYTVLADNIKALAGLIAGTEKNVSPVGPVGIVKMAKSQLESGVVNFLALMSYISLMLFLFNLLPIPALDGGRTVFLLYEVVTGQRVNKKVDATVNTVFFFILMALISVITVKELFWG